MRAVLAEPGRFDLSTAKTEEFLPGKRCVKAKSKDSMTIEPIAWELDCTEAEATAWLAASKIPFLRFEDTAPETVEFETEVLYAGTFRPQVGGGKDGTRTITVEMLNKIAETTNRLIKLDWLRPPGKLGHGEDQDKVRSIFPEGGEPALGFAQSLRVEGERLIAKFTGVPKRFAEMVKAGIWKPGSCEIAGKYTDPNGGMHEMALTAFAWLGGVRPAAPGLQTIGLSDASLGDLMVLALHEPEDAQGSPASASGEDHKEVVEQVAPLKDEPSQEEKAQMATIEELTAQLAEAKAARVKDRLTRAAADRKITPGEVEAKSKIALSMSDEGRDLYLAEIEAKEPGPDLTKPLVKAGDAPTPSEKSEKQGEVRLMELAEQIVESKKVPYGEALCLAAAKDPEAYAVYYREAHPLRSGEMKGGN